jgi:hypothetical protein
MSPSTSSATPLIAKTALLESVGSSGRLSVHDGSPGRRPSADCRASASAAREKAPPVPAISRSSAPHRERSDAKTPEERPANEREQACNHSRDCEQNRGCEALADGLVRVDRGDVLRTAAGTELLAGTPHAEG